MEHKGVTEFYIKAVNSLEPLLLEMKSRIQARAVEKLGREAAEGAMEAAWAAFNKRLCDLPFIGETTRCYRPFYAPFSG